MIRIAVIGMGVMGRNHYRVLRGMADVEVAAICDPAPEGGYEEPLYGSLDEMLSAVDFDAAVVAVPTSLHKEVAIKCLKRGIHLLIEKPVASSVGEGYEMLKALGELEAHGAPKTAVGHIERFNPVVGALKGEIKEDIYSISITRVGPFPPRMADVGVLTDLAVHDIDLIKFITGRGIKDVNIFKSRKIHDHYEDNAALSFELEGEVVASITTNWLTPFKKRKIEVATADAYYEADLITQELIEYSSYRSDGSYVAKNCFVKKGEPLKNELRAFIDYVGGGGRNSLASIEDSIETLRVVEGAFGK